MKTRVIDRQLGAAVCAGIHLPSNAASGFGVAELRAGFR